MFYHWPRDLLFCKSQKIGFGSQKGKERSRKIRTNIMLHANKEPHVIVMSKSWTKSNFQKTNALMYREKRKTQQASITKK